MGKFPVSSVPEPRIIPPDEARQALEGWCSSPTMVSPSFIIDLAHTAAVLGDQLAAVRALHVPAEMQVITGDCAAEECDHDDGCPTVPFVVCAGCDRLVEEVDPYAYEKAGLAQAIAYPCPTARAAGVTG